MKDSYLTEKIKIETSKCDMPRDQLEQKIDLSPAGGAPRKVVRNSDFLKQVRRNVSARHSSFY
jgi:hypothetical protein